ncbi:MAG: SDR family NAD(P)-dependent oxidoreductase [Candidatus Neomarinimicrobiota bacterium]
MNFTGKTVLVTGGAQGIGLAIVEHFLSLGADVHVMDKSDGSTGPESRNEFYHFFSGSVTVPDDVESFVKQVLKQSGKIDVLVNNAGILRDNVIWKMPEQDFDQVIDVNLKGPWLMCREVAPHMRKQNFGRIVNISSRSWLGNFGQSNYSASKAGLVSLTRVLALELGRHKVTVNAVAPGLIDTPMTRKLKAETFEKLKEALPGKEAGQPEDVARAVAFLAAPESGFITGQILYVDGGRSLGSTL